MKPGAYPSTVETPAENTRWGHTVETHLEDTLIRPKHGNIVKVDSPAYTPRKLDTKGVSLHAFSTKRLAGAARSALFVFICASSTVTSSGRITQKFDPPPTLNLVRKGTVKWSGKEPHLGDVRFPHPQAHPFGDRSSIYLWPGKSGTMNSRGLSLWDGRHVLAWVRQALVSPIWLKAATFSSTSRFGCLSAQSRLRSCATWPIVGGYLRDCVIVASIASLRGGSLGS